MNLFRLNLKIGDYDEIRFLIFFLFVFSLTGFFDNIIITINHSISSTLSFIRFSVILCFLLIFLFLLRIEKLKKLNHFSKNLFYFSFIIFFIELINSLILYSYNVNLKGDYLKQYSTLNYSLSWIYIFLIYVTIDIFLFNREKKLLFDIYIFGTLIFAFYVLIGKYINYSIGSNNYTSAGINRYFQVFSEDLFNRRFPLSQTFSYYFNFSICILCFIKTEIIKNLYFKIILILLFSAIVLVYGSLGASLTLISIFPFIIIKFFFKIKNYKFKKYLFYILALIIICFLILFFTNQFSIKEIIFNNFLVIKNLNFMNYIFYPDHLGGKEHSILVRYLTLNDSLNLITNNIIFGNGIIFNSLNQYMGSSSHQTILYPISAYGLFGLISFFIMLFSLLNLKKLNEDKIIYILIFFPIFFGVQIFNDQIPSYYALLFYSLTNFDKIND